MRLQLKTFLEEGETDTDTITVTVNDDERILDSANGVIDVSAMPAGTRIDVLVTFPTDQNDIYEPKGEAEHKKATRRR